MLSSRSRSPPKRPRQAPWASSASSQKGAAPSGSTYDPFEPTTSPERRTRASAGDLGLPKRVTSRPANRRPSLARSDASKTAGERALSRFD